MTKRIEIGFGEITIGEMIELAKAYNAKVTIDGDRHTIYMEVEE